MKRYVNYMDAIEAPEDLTEKLRGLQGRKKPFPVYRLAAAAAALALIVGVGAALRRAHAESPREPGELENSHAEPGPNGSRDDPVWSYDIEDGKDVSHFLLPNLDFADASGLTQAAADYTLCPWDGYERELEEKDLELIFDTDRVLEHLGWPTDADVVGAIYFSADGEAHGMSLVWTVDGQVDMCVEMLRGENVPTCVVLPDENYGATEVDGVKVTALVLPGSCEVKLFVDGFGYKATIHGNNYRELAARFVRLVLASRRGLEDVLYEYPTSGENEKLPANASGGAVTAPSGPAQ